MACHVKLFLHFLTVSTSQHTTTSHHLSPQPGHISII